MNKAILVTILIGILFLSGCVSSDSDSSNPLTGESTAVVEKTESVCSPSWECTEWSTCDLSYLQTRTCTDTNYCNTQSNKPEESRYCTPSDKCDVSRNDYFDYLSSETESTMNTCYKSKYFDYSTLKQNVLICNEIVYDSKLAECYANYYFEKKEEVCKSIPVYYYEARGYYDKISTQDVCYVAYVLDILLDDHSQILNKTLFTNNCNKIKNEQMNKTCWDFR